MTHYGVAQSAPVVLCGVWPTVPANRSPHPSRVECPRCMEKLAAIGAEARRRNPQAFKLKIMGR